MLRTLRSIPWLGCLLGSLGNPHEPDAPLSGISVRLEEGFLVIRGQLHDAPLTDYILLPVDNAHAVLAGNGCGLGYAFKRTPPPLSF